MSHSNKPLVLVVDDEPDILTLNRFILEQGGYQAITAGDGVDAIRKAIDFSPDVIVLDVMMPRMNGYQVCRLLKHDRRTSHIPIIICTVKSLESEKLYAYTSGADHYLIKPFEKEGLVELVQRCLKDVADRQSTSLRRGVVPRSRTSTDSILTDVNSLLDHRLMELTILQDLTRAMSSTLDLDGLLKVAQSNIRNIGYASARILLLSEEVQLEERAAVETPLTVDVRQHPFFLDVLRKGEVAILNSQALAKAVPADFRKTLHSQTIVFVPITAKGKAIGMLVVEKAPAQTLDRNQKEFLLTLASQAGLAIENANLYEKTLQLSITDGLTGIFNYRYFRERLENELARSKRYRNTVGLLIVDIDHFKVFNDRYGHLLGDDVLKSVASMLRENTRDVDIVARYGGEEFGVILNEIDLGEILQCAERIRASVEKFRVTLPDGSTTGVTVSLGVATCDDGMLDGQELIRRADHALYEAKDQGRNRICVWKEKEDRSHASESTKEDF